MSKRRTGKKDAGKAERQKRAKANSHYKDTVFRMLFREKTRLLGLYNAIGGRSYEDPEKLDIVMLERQELRLSAAYEVKEEDPELELRVQVLNINEGFNEGLKETCRTLKEYMRYVDKVREYAKDMSIDEAVDRAVDECIAQGVLREFLLQNKAEVKHMSIFEYNEEDVRQVLREALERRIKAETDENTLRKWLKLAGNTGSIEEFQMKL